MASHTTEELVDKFRHRREAGQAIVRAENVDQAVQVAAALKASGDAQWFRGQTADWPMLTPTFHRLPDDERSVALDAVNRFMTWAKRTDGLEDIAADDDKIIAIAQHYGLPTTFLDFTTEPSVAGFFAADGASPPAGVDSCIICIDLEQASSIWGSLSSTAPEPLLLDVPNLWRLEAQSGAFVWCPYDSLDGPYPLDRIIFPYAGPSAMPREAIYPDRASPLEMLLNHYFQQEAIRRGSAFLATYLRPHVSKTILMDDTGDYRAGSFAHTPQVHRSWTEAAPGWVVMQRQRWTGRAPVDLVLDLRYQRYQRYQRPTLNGQPLATEIEQALAGGEFAHVRWSADISEPELTPHATELGRRLQRIWEGMARLPYSAGQITTAIETMTALWVAKMMAGLPRRDIAESQFGSIVGIELGGMGTNVHARAYVADTALRAAMRRDFSSLLTDDQRERVMGLTFNILMTARNPRLLFNFERLCELFASQIVPTQVALDFGNPTFFSPARCDIIGPE